MARAKKLDQEGVLGRMAQSVASIPSQDVPRIFRVPLEEIEPNPHQPRKQFDQDALEELARSIEQHGLMQPVSVIRKEDDAGYILVAGERRYRAHKLLERESINAIVLTEGNVAALAVIENVQRENLNPIELAEGLARLQEEFDYDQITLAETIGKKRNTVNEILRLNSLPQQIKDESRTSDSVTKSVLIQIVRVDDEAKQLALWEDIKRGGTVKAVRAQRKKDGQVRTDPLLPYRDMLAAGRNLKRKIESLPPEWVVHTDEQYQELADLHGRLGHALDMYQERRKQAEDDE